jgi:hypothetical protein
MFDGLGRVFVGSGRMGCSDSEEGMLVLHADLIVRILKQKSLCLLYTFPAQIMAPANIFSRTMFLHIQTSFVWRELSFV